MVHRVSFESPLELCILENESFVLLFEDSWVLLFLNETIQSSKNESVSYWPPTFMDFVQRAEINEKVLLFKMLFLNFLEISIASGMI